MIAAIQTALSGLAAYSKHIEVASHHVANAADGFKKSRAEFVEVETEGVLPVVQKDDSAGPAVLKDTGHGPTEVERLNVEPGEEAIHRMIAQRAFEANLRALKTADDILGSILDMKK